MFLTMHRGASRIAPRCDALHTTVLNFEDRGLQAVRPRSYGHKTALLHDVLATFIIFAIRG